MKNLGHGALIIGGGHASVELASSLRVNGYEHPIRIVTEEIYLPYQRPPLSKKYLEGKVGSENLYLRNAQFFEQNGIDLLLSERAVKIDRQMSSVLLESGRSVSYDTLVIATGARNKPLPLHGANAKNVFNLRSMKDSESLKSELQPGRRLIVIGGGFVGLEVAATARLLGLEVTVVEAADRLLSRVVGVATSNYIAGLHTSEGTHIELGKSVTTLHCKDERVVSVTLSNGQVRDCDVIFYGIGAVANKEIAEEAGLAVDRGVLVASDLITNDPAIFAIGDCAEHIDVRTGTRCRLESVQNAIGQAKVVAKQIVGEDVKYSEVPWFWSDQYKTKLQTVGVSNGATHEIIRGEADAGSFSVFYFSGETLICVDSINRPGDHMIARRLLTKAPLLTPEMVQNADLDLRTVVV